MTRTLFTLLVALIPATAFANNAPDLCADLYLDDNGEPLTDAEGRTLSRFCEPSGPNPPVWGEDICCNIGTDGADCAPAVMGRCLSGAHMWCEYGEEIGGKVSCYNPFPDTCDEGYCEAELIPGLEGLASEFLCCFGTNICYGWPSHKGCEGELSVCLYGATNEDGTVTCFDH